MTVEEENEYERCPSLLSFYFEICRRLTVREESKISLLAVAASNLYLELKNGVIFYRKDYSLDKVTVDLANRRCRARLAFALYHSFLHCGMTYCPKVIAMVCNVPSKALLHQEYERCYSDFGNITPLPYLRLACDLLELPEYMIVRALSMMRTVEDKYFGLEPQVLCAVAFWCLVTHERKNNVAEHVSIKPALICDLFNVSLSHFQKWYRNMPTFHLVDTTKIVSEKV